MIEVALKEFGTREIVGRKHNDEVLKYFTETGHSWVKDDETAWCSAFWNWVAKKSGYEVSGKLNARSWMKVGESVDLEQAKPGDTVVLWRESRSSWKGHVGGYIRHNAQFIWILGGNQNNEVNIKKYNRNRLLGVRRLKRVAL